MTRSWKMDLRQLLPFKDVRLVQKHRAGTSAIKKVACIFLNLSKQKFVKIHDDFFVCFLMASYKSGSSPMKSFRTSSVRLVRMASSLVSVKYASHARVRKDVLIAAALGVTEPLKASPLTLMTSGRTSISAYLRIMSWSSVGRSSNLKICEWDYAIINFLRFQRI